MHCCNSFGLAISILGCHISKKKIWVAILALRGFNIIDMKKKFSERWPFHLIFHVMLDQGSMLIDAAHCQPKFEERAAKRPKALFLYEFSSFMSSLLEVELIVLVLLHPAIKLFV